MSKFRTNKSTSIVISGAALTRIREFAKLAGVDEDTYVIQAALSYPLVLKELSDVNKLAEEAGLFNEPEATISTGTGETESGKEG